MPHALRLQATDRLLFFAPHPDDESLGGGGLVQKAVTAGAQTRFVFLTSGDRNPWPQRILERRLLVGPKARGRWGARRRQEALKALALLGVGEPAEAHFLNWPDQGVTSLLMSADEGAMETICRLIAEWRPTHLLTPAAEDTHPDHSAFFVLLQMALDRVRRQGVHVPHVFSYLVHVPKARLALDIRALELSSAEMAVKAGAIQAHESQMLSRKRFLAHVTELERFHVPIAAAGHHPHHPILSADQGRGALRLKLRLPKALLSYRGARLHLALETVLEGSLRWTLALPGSTGKVRVVDAVSGQPARWATVRIRGRNATICVPILSAQPLDRMFAKFERRKIFFDLAGWRELPVDEGCGPKVQLHRFDAAKRPV
jgi:LmbE family N-acetylglucosaminyl deacetylase